MVVPMGGYVPTRRRDATPLKFLVLLAFTVLMLAGPSSGSRALLGRDLDSFQCWDSVQIAGYNYKTVLSLNADQCEKTCLKEKKGACTAFTFTRLFQCQLKTLPFHTAFGKTQSDRFVSTSCILKTEGGALPSPKNTMCYSGQNIAGRQIKNADTGASNSSSRCAALCIKTAGCSFSVFFGRGLDGISRPVCQLKTNPFVGGPESNTVKTSLVTSICLRAAPAPAVIDPLVDMSGPLPFLIKSRISSRCLVAASPYTSGQSPLFASDCSGAGALWLYNKNTQVMTHYASGLCLAAAPSAQGSAAVLSSDCSPAPSNQIQSNAWGWLQVSEGYRWLQPAALQSKEGIMMIALSECPQDQFEFVAAPEQAYQCYRNINIAGKKISSRNANDSQKCATRCLTTGGCTSYVFEAKNPTKEGTCTLQSDAFVGGKGGVTRDSKVAESCLTIIGNGELPSPANHICYQGQRVSGTSLKVSQATSPQSCVEQCIAAPGCTFSYFTEDYLCTTGSNVFAGDSAGSVQDPSVSQMCLVAKGAPDTVFQKGYTCYVNTDIAGDLISSEQSSSLQNCSLKCEAMSDICSLAVFTETNTCNLLANPFSGLSGTTGVAAGKTSCLRSRTGGVLNSPGDFLCYPSQRISGTFIAQGAGVADTSSCAAVCDGTQGCEAALFVASNVGTCILKKDPFHGNDGEPNEVDYGVSALCLAAPGAPVVTSGFGMEQGGFGIRSGGFGVGLGSVASQQSPSS